ncbi:pentapeptide repeat-containing protein [Saccharothrix sp. NRRL B-16314]|uniref:pentapeptide repeat-containing protein n=1 Tax=Saccharothrix sp. NRRL B-16314 TaxID=1463825 RepID=UPI0012DBD3DD|nr:pentapeptide repeat-containing protein [Saccharothrix sp. NRRL B-16314]
MLDHLAPYLPAGLTFLGWLWLVAWFTARQRRKRASVTTLEVPTAGVAPVRHMPASVKGSMAGALVKWLFVAAVLAAATGYGLYRLLGRPALPSSTSFTTAELLDLLKIGLAVVGGLGAVVALAVGYRKQQVSEAAHVIANRQEERERTKFFNERYGRAAEQLGHESFAVRLAGVYAMVGLADDWPEQRQICVDVLSGYLRTPYPQDDRTEREVRQEIINALLDHTLQRRWQVGKIRMDFRGVEFEDLDLSRRTFSGTFSFDNAIFHGKRTDFANCRFNGTVSFRKAKFISNTTSFEGISALSSTLDFSEAEFTGDVVDFSTADLVRSTVDLTGAVLRDTVLTFRGLVGRALTIALDSVELSRSTVDLSMMHLPVQQTKSVIGLRAVDAQQCAFRFGGGYLPNTDVRLTDAEFTECTVETDGTEPADVVRALRGIGGVGSPDGTPDATGEPQ